MGNKLCSKPHHIGDAVDFDVQGLLTRAAARDYSAFAGAAIPAAGGQSLLFLERCQDVPQRPPSILGDPFSACSAPSGAGAGGSATAQRRLHVHAWAQAGAKTLGQVAEWPARPSTNGTPAWFSARPVGVDLLSAQSAAGATAAPQSAEAPQLVIEVYDSGALLAMARVPLAELRGHSTMSAPLRLEGAEGQAVSSGRPCTVSFQVLNAAALTARRRVVYLVRHGESVWNAAQSAGNVPEMARQNDHPLSAKGRSQAAGLRARVDAAAKRGDKVGTEFMHAGAVYTSPLCRAVQTACIALGQETLGASGEFVLMPAVREKQNLGGLDSMSSKLGAEIIEHAHEDLCSCGDAAMFTAMSAQDLASTRAAMARLRYDVMEADEPWWCEHNSDSDNMLRERLKECITQLLYMPATTAVVVGHSHYFRSLLKTYISQEFAASQPELHGELTRKKMQNCGVVRLELDPTIGAEARPIVDVKLVFGTRLDADGQMFGACCVNPGHDDDSCHGLEPVPSADSDEEGHDLSSSMAASSKTSRLAS